MEKWLKSMDKATVYEGHGRFESPESVRVGGDLLEADKIFINTGARAAIPPIPGLGGVNYLTNTQMMDLDFLPDHLLILGEAISVWSSDRCIAASEARQL